MVGLFAAGGVLLNPPVLTLVGGKLLGWPALYVYLFVVWGLLILGIALVSEGAANQANERDKDDGAR